VIVLDCGSRIEGRSKLRAIRGCEQSFLRPGRGTGSASVPRKLGAAPDTVLPRLLWGTEGSNPSPSTASHYEPDFRIRLGPLANWGSLS